MPCCAIRACSTPERGLSRSRALRWIAVMERHPPAHGARARAGLGAALVAVLVATPALAQYKVVGPDGRVTYTDRPPLEAGSRVTPFAARSAPAAPDAALPIELRSVVARYPVTLYVGTDRCDACDAARKLLRERGVPHDERTVSSATDLDALQAATGARDVPALRIGQQVLRGLVAPTWHSYLDAAGYPRESLLPSGWRWAAATPLTERQTVAATPPARRAPPARAEPAPAAAPATEPEPGTIRF